MHLRHIFIEMQAVRVERVKPVHAAKNQTAVRGFEVACAVELIVLQAVRHGEVFGRFRPHVEAAKAPVRAHPDVAGRLATGRPVLRQDAVHHIVRQPFFFGKMLERARCLVQAVQPAALGTYPKKTLRFERVVGDAEHGVDGQGVAVGRVVQVLLEAVSVLVGHCFDQPRETENPDDALAVFVDKLREIGQPCLRFFKKEMLAGFRSGVEAVQPFFIDAHELPVAVAQQRNAFKRKGLFGFGHGIGAGQDGAVGSIVPTFKVPGIACRVEGSNFFGIHDSGQRLRSIGYAAVKFFGKEFFIWKPRGVKTSCRVFQYQPM
jgi:hypothetical protein